MSTTSVLALWLPVLGLSIHVFLLGLQSNTLNAGLAKFSLPPIPSAAFPWLGTILGLGAGIVYGVQQNQTLAVAVATALTSLLSGVPAGMSALAHADKKADKKNAPPAAPPALASVPAAPISTPTVEVQIPVVPPSRNACIGFGLALLGPLCLAFTASCIPAKSPAQQEADALAGLQCVETNWGKSPAVIAGLCFQGEVAVAEDALADIELIFARAGISNAAGDPYVGDLDVQSRVASKRAAQ